jgi:hypothetical protein
MRIRRSAIAILAVVGGAAIASVAVGQGQVSGTVASGTATGTTVTASPPGTMPESPESANVPSNERTYPQVRPTKGGRLTSFALTFTLRDAPGHQGVLEVDYRVQVTAPPGAAASCIPNQPPPIERGAVGELEQITLPPPAHGWCGGTYRATVFLQRGPYCPPPVEGQPPTPCPEFATQELDTGTASFTVAGAGSPRRNARIVGEVKVCNAPGRCTTRAFNVSAIDSSRNIVAESSTFGTNNRYRLRVPAGHYSLQATSNGLNCAGSATARRRRAVTANITCLVP